MNAEYKQAVESAKVVLVEFYASWCPHCQRMMPVVADVKKKVEGKGVKVYQYDIDANSSLADEEGVESIPTFILYNSDKEVWRQSGELSEDALLSKIDAELR